MADDAGAWEDGGRPPGAWNGKATVASAEAWQWHLGTSWGQGEAGPRRGGQEDKWLPIVQAGLLLKEMKIKSLEGDLLLLSAIKESEIAHFFLGASLN